jgi:phage terminase large subunit-like protein
MAREDWVTSLPDWQQRIVARQSLIPPLPLWQDRADRALRIFKRLRLVDVLGEPTMGEACARWVFDFVRTIFGAYDQAAARQVIREFLLLVAKKNGKSSIAAGIMVTALIMNERRQGEYLILAPTKDVADNSFSPAFGMINADPVLKARFKPSAVTRVIENRLDGASLSVKAADAETVGGQKAIGILIDELWLFGKKASAENILSEATGSLAARPEGFVIYLSTESDEPPAGVFKKRLDYHRDVRDGLIVDPTSLPLIYEYPPDMLRAERWRDSETFYIPNPSLGHGVDLEWLSTEYRKKETEGAGSLRLFIAKHLNVEIGMNLRGNRWPGADYWEGQAERGLTREAVLDRCEVIVVGIDGGGLDDLFGLSVLGRERVESEFTITTDGVAKVYREKRWLLWSHAWCHRGVLTRRKIIASRLQDFALAGELTIVDDQLGDISAMVDIVEEIKDRGLLGAVAADPYSLGEFQNAMVTIGVTEENKLLVGVGQGWRMMNAIKTAERRLARGMLRHGGSGLMAWCVGNLKIEATATAIRATKQGAGDQKIDPAMAMFDAIDIMSTNPEATGKRELQYFFA